MHCRFKSIYLSIRSTEEIFAFFVALAFIADAVVSTIGGKNVVNMLFAHTKLTFAVLALTCKLLTLYLVIYGGGRPSNRIF